MYFSMQYAIIIYSCLFYNDSNIQRLNVEEITNLPNLIFYFFNHCFTFSTSYFNYYSNW